MKIYDKGKLSDYIPGGVIKGNIIRAGWIGHLSDKEPLSQLKRVLSTEIKEGRTEAYKRFIK